MSKKQNEKKTGSLKNNRIMAYILMVLLLAAGTIGFVAAKYLYDYKQEAEIHASDFHFSSNYLEYISLSSEPKVSEMNVSDWGDRHVKIMLYNYEKENIAQISDTDIQYTINVDEGWSVLVEDAEGNSVVPVKTEEELLYTMTASEAAVYQCVTLTYTGQGVPEDVTVAVKSVSPYEKELKGKFILSTKKDFEYEVIDKGDYNIVTVCTNNYSGPITVKWDDGKHSPDNTCDYMESWRDGEPGKLNTQAYTVYTMIFLEKVSADYTKADFVIEIGE